MKRFCGALIARRVPPSISGRVTIGATRTFASESKDDKFEMDENEEEEEWIDEDGEEVIEEEIEAPSIPESSPFSEFSRRQRLQSASDLLSRPRSARAPVSTVQPIQPIPSLSIPLDADHDFIDPVVATRVRTMTPDDILATELIDVERKLVATRDELRVMLQAERQEMRDEREAVAAEAAARRSAPRDLSKENTNYIDEIDMNNEYEQLILDNPESMRRQKVIELKEVRQGVKQRIMQLDERYDLQLDSQAAVQEAQRVDTEARLKRFEEATAAAIAAGRPGSVDISEFNERPDANLLAAQEAAEHVKLRENVIHQYRAKFGEREGDDYELDEEESLFEPPDTPPERRKRPPNAMPLIRPRKVDQWGRSTGSGGRKASHGYCWLKPGTGTVTVNGENTALYFNRLIHRSQVIRPLMLTNQSGLYDIEAYCSGGGKTGQAGALQFAVARALANQDPALRDRLKKAGMLTRDTRKVERKKPGKYKARKSYTYVKR